MRTLLVPVDDTDNSLNAARYAADMALAIEGDVHLLHVVRIPAMPAEAPVGYVFDQLEKAGLALLDRLAAELMARTRGQVTVRTLQVIGGVEYQIAEVSRQLRPFAVVMGAPRGSVLGAIGGSPAVDAARHLPYPVLVIPAGAGFRRIRRIVLAAEAGDIESGLPVTVAFLRELRDLFAARFDVVNVARRSDSGESGKVFELYRWKEAWGELYPELHFVAAEDIAEGVDKYIGEHEADWLMLFPKSHRWMEFHRSRSAGMVAHSRVPVMSVCEEANRTEAAAESIEHLP
ncbi:MAG TPA: universal stress protein [Puia sp.]|uniref:universal stress protein n=1 Tax=Puia sp. TaxID=2045100 RepID=UPI002CC0221F|nr:universal stress protein [Puia sp.]HVU94179.1 universal stress protein [Puia sp.]